MEYDTLPTNAPTKPLTRVTEAAGKPLCTHLAGSIRIFFLPHVSCLAAGTDRLAGAADFCAGIPELRVTGDNMYPESAGVLDAQRWAQGLPLYSDYRQPHT